MMRRASSLLVLAVLAGLVAAAAPATAFLACQGNPFRGAPCTVGYDGTTATVDPAAPGEAASCREASCVATLRGGFEYCVTPPGGLQVCYMVRGSFDSAAAEDCAQAWATCRLTCEPYALLGRCTLAGVSWSG